MSKTHKATTAFVILLIATTLMPWVLPEANADPSSVNIVSIDPETGGVGTIVQVIGAIETTNGSYKIYFDGKEVENGTSVGTAVNTTFAVPLSAKGSHNVTLWDVTNNTESLPATFNVTTSYNVATEPARIQEDFDTTITVGVNEAEANATYAFTINVTDPQPTAASYTATLIIFTNATGSGFNSTLYHGNFSLGANTNYVGNYTVAVMTANETLATGNFTVCLTEKLDYKRNETVSIRGAGYNAGETVTLNIEKAGVSVAGYPKNVTADSGGVVTHSWNILMNSTPGTYTVTLTNATIGGTVKPVSDVQTFWVERIFIDPPSGGWGTTVRVVGETLTVNGSYQILWDGENVGEGTCESGTAKVVADFAVSPSVKGYHNITLRDVNQTTESMPATFQVTTFCYVSAKPARILEGFPSNITVGVREAEANKSYTFAINVTDPLNRTWTENRLVATGYMGSGNSTLLYPNDFTGADTDYLGSYGITVNATLANGSFTVGLTDAIEYRVTNDVIIRGSGYDVGKFVTVNITHVVTGETVFSESRNATDGTVSYIWTIPENATLGTYSVTLANATTQSTVKPIPDVQNFTVIRIIVYVQARNKYDDTEFLAGVTIETYIGIAAIVSGTTNKTGWVNFTINRANYTFLALWKNRIVGNLSQGILGNPTDYVLQKNFYIGCELAHITIAIIDESDPPQPLPFINVSLTSNKTETLALVTDYTGTITTKTFTNVSYMIEARRYGHLFNRTLIDLFNATRINITCPTYNLFANILDSNGLPLQNVQVDIVEWTSARVMERKATDALGSVSFNGTFGRYKIKVYNYSAELNRVVILNETVIDLVEDRFFFAINCKISNLNLSIMVVDYFGQPIPNAEVELERELEQGYESISNLKTGSDGTASLPRIGGNYRISVYVTGRLFETRTLYLDESKVIVFKIDKLVVFGGYPFETTQFITGISLAILVALLALALIYRRLRLRKESEGEEKEKSL